MIIKPIMKAYSARILALAFLYTACDKSQKLADSKEKSTGPSQPVRPASPKTNKSSSQNERLQSAFREAKKLHTPEERNRALSSVAWDALELDQDLASEAFAQMTPGSEEKNRLLEHFVMRSAEENVEAATRWADSLGTDREKSLAFGKIALVVAEKEPERAARILSESGVAGHDFDVAVVEVVQRWAATSPPAAAAWLSLFKAGDARTAGLEQVVSIWIHKDPKAACAWIPSIKDAKLRQEAEQGAAQTILNAPKISQVDLLKFATPAIRAQFSKLQIQTAAQSH
jgi:hypothetical protein